MTPLKLAPPSDGQGADFDRDADIEGLKALLRLPLDDEPDDARVLAVIAATRAAAGRTPQWPPSLAMRLRTWLGGLVARPDDGLWRFGVPVTVALVLGVLVGHASVDEATSGDTVTSNVESLIASPQSLEFFGL